MSDLLWPEVARTFRPRQRRYPRPGDLAMSVDPRTGTSPALNKIDDALIELMDKDSPHNGLAVFMPPQEGKSQRISRRYPEWLLDHDPSLRIIIVSYEQDTALRWGRDIKQDILQSPCQGRRRNDCDEQCGGLHIPIRRDSAAAGRWETPQGGGVYCAGVGGPIAGRPADILIIDDPVKDRAAAESKTIRESTWDWWESVAIARLGTGARVCLITTRWHEDDLAGRIFSRPSPLKWRKLVIPAIAGDKDELGRRAGQEMTSVRKRPPGHFKNLRATMSPYAFSGIYQQNPTAPEGNFFRRASFRYWRWGRPTPDGRRMIECEGGRYALGDCWRFATVDVAASKKDTADFTVVSVWAMTGDGNLILLDRHRNRVPEHDHFAMVAPLRATWGFDVCYVESSYYSSTLVSDARDHGVPVAKLTADTDKVTRAIPAAGRVHSGRVWFPAETSGCPCGNCPDGVWLDEWCDELATFPQGAHDDQVDTLSYAARIAVADWTPAHDEARVPLTAWDHAIAAARASATGDGSGDMDLLNVPY